MWLALRIMLLLVLVTTVAMVIVWYCLGGRLYSVQTGSMQPEFKTGDAILTQKIHKVRIGDIVSYRDVSSPSLILSHRVIGINTRSGQLTTKGDHNPQPDNPIANWQLLGRATMVAPRLGSFIDWVRKPLGLIITLYIPALVTAIVVLWSLIGERYLPYRLR